MGHRTPLSGSSRPPAVLPAAALVAAARRYARAEVALARLGDQIAALERRISAPSTSTATTGTPTTTLTCPASSAPTGGSPGAR
ncbi:MAG TPA: hypothetical protein VHL53_11105 [Acidimicrobiia bacterium]|nr:hypothetical protein [Acidimicrobiia bacterium]